MLCRICGNTGAKVIGMREMFSFNIFVPLLEIECPNNHKFFRTMEHGDCIDVLNYVNSLPTKNSNYNENL